MADDTKAADTLTGDEPGKPAELLQDDISLQELNKFSTSEENFEFPAPEPEDNEPPTTRQEADTTASDNLTETEEEEKETEGEEEEKPEGEEETETEGEEEEKPEGEEETETEGEEEEKPKPEDKRDADNYDSEKDKDLPKGVRRRLDKLTKTKYELREALESKDREVSQLKSKKDRAPLYLNPTDADPLAHCNTEEHLEKIEERAEQVLDMADLHPDGYTQNEGKENEKEISPKAVREAKIKARRYLRAIPDRVRFLGQRADYEDDAHKAYPEYYEEGTDMQKMSQGAKRVFPEVMLLPDQDLFIADMLRGQRLRKELPALAEKDIDNFIETFKESNGAGKKKKKLPVKKKSVRDPANISTRPRKATRESTKRTKEAGKSIAAKIIASGGSAESLEEGLEIDI